MNDATGDPVKNLQSATLKIGETIILSKLYWSPAEAHAAIKQSLRTRLCNETVSLDDIITVTVKDASGYFVSCPEIFFGYYNETLSVAQYMK